jgi:hypothetical protein
VLADLDCEDCVIEPVNLLDFVGRLGPLEHIAASLTGSAWVSRGLYGQRGAAVPKVHGR